MSRTNSGSYGAVTAEMRWPTRSADLVIPHRLPLLRAIGARVRTGAPRRRGDPTTQRVLLWFAIIVGLLAGFWLETILVVLVHGM